ncbi:hypothetical protein D3C87_1538390 [compost metagenome]
MEGPHLHKVAELVVLAAIHQQQIIGVACRYGYGELVRVSLGRHEGHIQVHIAPLLQILQGFVVFRCRRVPEKYGHRLDAGLLTAGFCLSGSFR